MTKFHQHNDAHREFLNSRVGMLLGAEKNLELTRRDFLRGGIAIINGALLLRFLENLLPASDSLEQETIGKRIYIAPDDHTDLFWTNDLAAYEKAFVEMLDFYLDLAEQTQNDLAEFQSRWNCDGSFWVQTYEKDKTKVEFERLIEGIRNGHISVPLNALCICLGGAPAEAVLRGMYYPGRLERRYNLRFKLAYSMENQTLPYGLGALWSGSGATFSWKGICNCATLVPNPWDREYDIYWWVGADGSRILMKWNSMFVSSEGMGGYAEARYPEETVNFVNSDENFRARYPYQIIGAFGSGWDEMRTRTDKFVVAAKNLSNQDFKVIVSNEIDFSQDFEKTYGNEIPSLSCSFGNEWDLDCASMAEVSARLKRAVEKLRSSEGLATLVTLKRSDFMQDREESRELAWMNLGLYWEHDWQGAPWDDLTTKRISWQRQITDEIESYVDQLHNDSLMSLGNMIKRSGVNQRFFVYNSLSWSRTDYADLEYSNTEPIHVVDLENDQETQSQFVIVDGKRYLRILARNIPSVGYKVFEVRDGNGQFFPKVASVNGNQLENQFLKLLVADRGAIISMEDKTRSNRQFVREINGMFLNDLGPGTGNLQTENDGAVTITLLSTAETVPAHTTRITLQRDSDRIDIQNDINQNFDSTQIWGFGFALDKPDVYHEEVGAILRARLTTQSGHYSPRNARYDWLTLNHFFAISGEDDRVGVTISNADCYFMKLGNSTVEKLDTQTSQISILAGSRELNGPGVLLNQGGDTHFRQRFSMKIHDAFDSVKSMRFALEHQNPLVAGQVSGGNEFPEFTYSLLEIDNPKILAWAIKPADDGLDAGIVVRLWNLSDDQEEFSLELANDHIVGALTLSHIETPLAVSLVKDGRLQDSLNSQQLKTYSVFTDQSKYSLASEGLESPIETPVTKSTATHPVTDGDRFATATPPVEFVSATPLPNITPVQTPAQSGKGCLLGLLEMLIG